MQHVLQNTVRKVYRGLVPQRAKNTLRQWLLFDERDKPMRAFEPGGEGAVLVIAPHMDDEVIGCGGAIRLHALAGDRVTVLFLTDGRLGDPNINDDPSLGDEARREAQGALSERRCEESRAAGKILGAGEPVFWNEPDGSLEPTEGLAVRLRELIGRLRPGAIYLPAMVDRHEDHWAANRLFRAMLAGGMPALPPQTPVRQYEVWTPVFANILARIDSVLEDKRRALRCFASQAPFIGVEHVTLGLNAYRSIYPFGGAGYAEAFFETPVSDYACLFDRLAASR